LKYANLFITNKTLRLQIGTFLKTYFLENFSPEKIAQCIKEVILNEETDYKKKDFNYLNLPLIEDEEYLLKFDILTKKYKNPWKTLYQIYCKIFEKVSFKKWIITVKNLL
jgi:hypothetical protein